MGFVKLKHPIKKTWFVFKLQQTMSKTYRTKVIFLIKIILIIHTTTNQLYDEINQHLPFISTKIVPVHSHKYIKHYRFLFEYCTFIPETCFTLSTTNAFDFLLRIFFP